MKTLRLDNFSNEMNNFVSAKHLDQKTAQVLLDGNGVHGSLRPESAPAELGVYELSALDHYGWIDRTVIKWYDKNYWSLDNAEVAPFYGGDLGYLGVPPHADTLSIAACAPAGTGLAGNFKYCMTVLTAEGWESAPGEMEARWWSGISLTDQAVSITLPAAKDLDDIVSAIRIYRTPANDSEYYLIGEYSLAQLGTTITDELSDLDLVFNISLETVNYLPPPDKGKFLTENDGTFYLAVGDRLYIGKSPHAWHPMNWISGFDGDITGITKEFSGILVFTANKASRVLGSDINTLTKQELPTQQGCINNRTIGKIGNVPIWCSNDGICIWDGSQVQLVSFGRYEFNDVPLHAVCANDRYHLFFEDKSIIYDRRGVDVFRESSVTCDYGWYDAAQDKFYTVKVQPDNSKLVYLFGSGEIMKFIYLSGILPTDGTVLCLWYRFIVDAAGSVDVIITTDKGKQASFTLNGRGKIWSYLPKSFYAHGVTVQIESRYEVFAFELEYEVKGK